jgi:hypothetical protein
MVTSPAPPFSRGQPLPLVTELASFVPAELQFSGSFLAVPLGFSLLRGCLSGGKDNPVVAAIEVWFEV